MAYKNIANGAQDVAKNVLAEVRKRVPPNQLEQFMSFRDKNAKFSRRVTKYPQRLPPIDWDYYRSNVRAEYVKMVDDFEKKYEELNKVYDSRGSLDTSKYYVEVEKQRAEVQSEVNKYIAKSNERIKSLEKEIERIKSLKEYNHMTLEEFICMRPECATYIPYGGKPLFWPHLPDEQKPGPAGVQKGAPDPGSDGGPEPGGKDGKKAAKGDPGSKEGQKAAKDDPGSKEGQKAAKGDGPKEVKKDAKDPKKDAKSAEQQPPQAVVAEIPDDSFVVKETAKDAKGSFGCGFLNAEQKKTSPEGGTCAKPKDSKPSPCDARKVISVCPQKDEKPKEPCYKPLEKPPEAAKDAKPKQPCDKPVEAAPEAPKDAKPKQPCDKAVKATPEAPKDAKPKDACGKKAEAEKCQVARDACADLKKKKEEEEKASKFDPCGIISKVSKACKDGMKKATGDKQCKAGTKDAKKKDPDPTKNEGGKKKK